MNWLFKIFLLWIFFDISVCESQKQEDRGSALKVLLRSNLTDVLAGIDLGAGGIDQLLKDLNLDGGEDDQPATAEDIGSAVQGLLASNFTDVLAGIDLGTGGLAELLNHMNLGGGGDNGNGTNHHPAIAALLPHKGGDGTDQAPATPVLLAFVEKLEKVHGGGTLLSILIKSMENVTEDQLKEVTELMPLITAHPAVSNGGFLKLMAAMDSTDEGKQLVQWAIGLLSNITNDHIVALTTAVPLIAPLLMEQLPSMVTLVESPNSTFSNVVDGAKKIVKGLNTGTLKSVLGNTSLSKDVMNLVSIVKSSDTIRSLAVHLLYSPLMIDVAGATFGNQAANTLKQWLTFISTLENETEKLNLTSTSTLENIFTVVESVNNTQLDTYLEGSPLNPLMFSYVSRLQSRSEKSSISPQCKADMEGYFNGLKQFDMWALKMLDASGKPGSSVLKGAVKFYGNYDECLAISTTLATGDGTGREIKGSYCRLAFILPKSLLDKTGAMDTPMPLPADFVPALEWHLCLPKSCDENTISTALSILPLEAINSSVYKVDCTQDQDIADDSGALASLAILGIIVILSVVGTLYDVISGEIGRLHRKYGTNDEKYDSSPISGFASNGTSHTDKPSNGIAMLKINGVKVDNSGPPETDSISTSTQPYEGGDDDENYDGICRRLLLSFSFSRNTNKIFDTTKKEGSLGCIHGIRVLSMAWIILGHIIVYTKGVSDENVTEVLKQIKDFTMQAVVNAPLAVDTFFLIGGCLVAYLFIQDTGKTGKLTGRQMAMYYIHRFWRLWPLYLIILMTYTCLFKYMMDGPLRTDGIAYDNIHCQSNWWTNALFINNVYKTDEGCMRWTWFMANDMQFYIIAPVALLPVVVGLPAVGIVIMVLLFIVQIATYAYKEYSVDGSMLKNDEEFEREIYFMPWCRVGVFSMGLLLGYILNKTKLKVHIPRFALVIGWQMTLTIGLLCTYITWSEWKVGHINWSRDTRLVHETLSRPGWGLFVSWIIFVCCTGHGGIVNRLLSWSAWMPLGRLTYGAYLIHPILITYTDFSKRALVYVDFIFISYQFIGTFVISYALSFLFSVLVEAPCMALEKLAIGRFRREH